MNLSFFIAKRYLFAKKSRNVINLISAISATGVAFSTMALVVVLSVFNGLESLVKSLVSPFDPDLRITLVKGKVFSLDIPAFEKIKKMPEIAYFNEVLEENALFEYGDKQFIGAIKGVGENFKKMNPIDEKMTGGEFVLNLGTKHGAIVGKGVAIRLSLSANRLRTLKIWVPRRTIQLSSDAESAFSRSYAFPVGVFTLNDEEYDTKYVITSLEFARNLLEYKTEVSSVDLKMAERHDVDQVQKNIEKMLGNGFSVKNKYQQHEMLYKIMESEKWAVFLILSFIILIASFNIVSSLTMLIIDKKDDIGMLKNFGAPNRLIKRIFLYEGWLISIIGTILGIVFGLLLSFLQKEFGLIRFVGSSLVDAYPVEILYFDVLMVFVTVVLIGYIAAWYPVRYITSKYFYTN